MSRKHDAVIDRGWAGRASAHPGYLKERAKEWMALEEMRRGIVGVEGDCAARDRVGLG